MDLFIIQIPNLNNQVKEAVFKNYSLDFPPLRTCNRILGRIHITQGFFKNYKTVRKLSKTLIDISNTFAKQILQDIKLRATF